MIKPAMNGSATAVLDGLLASLAACQKPQRLAETAGTPVDKAGGQLGQQVQKAGASIVDAAKGDKQ